MGQINCEEELQPLKHTQVGSSMGQELDSFCCAGMDADAQGQEGDSGC